MLKSNCRYPFHPHMIAQVCNGEFHITLKTGWYSAPACTVLDALDSAVPCDGHSCKGWHPVKKPRVK